MDNYATPPVPPPVSGKGPMSVGKIIAIVFAVLLIGCAGLAAVGFFGFRYITQKPEPHPDFGKPRQVMTVGDWASYAFTEVAARIPLPSEPVPDKMDFELGAGVHYSYWMLYSAESEVSNFLLGGYWHHDAKTIDLESDARYLDSMMSEYGYANVRSTIKRHGYGALTGFLVDGAYTEDGEDAKYRRFLFQQGNAVVYLHAEYWASAAADAEAEFDRIMTSWVPEPPRPRDLEP